MNPAETPAVVFDDYPYTAHASGLGAGFSVGPFGPAPRSCLTRAEQRALIAEATRLHGQMEAMRARRATATAAYGSIALQYAALARQLNLPICAAPAHRAIFGLGADPVACKEDEFLYSYEKLTDEAGAPTGMCEKKLKVTTVALLGGGVLVGGYLLWKASKRR